jgi:hypothetical protein
LRVVCTDRGQHKPATIGLAVSADPRHPLRGPSSSTQPPLTDRTAAAHRPQLEHASSRSHRFVCRRCGRDVRLDTDALGAIIRVFGAAGRVDISLLPF